MKKYARVPPDTPKQLKWFSISLSYRIEKFSIFSGNSMTRQRSIARGQISGNSIARLFFIWMRTSANLPNCPKVPRRQHSTAPLSLRSSRQGISGLPKHGTRSTMSAIPMPHTAVLSLLQSWQNCASCLHALFSVERLAQLRRTTRHRPRRQRQYHNHEHIRQHDRKFIGKANSKHLDRELERLSDAEKKTPA